MWQGHERGSVEVHDATDEAGPLPKPRCPLLVVVWGPNAAQAQVFTQLMAHRGDVNVAAPRVLAKARHSREGNAFRTGLARVGVSALHAFRRRLQPPTLRKPGLDAVKLKALLVGFLQEYYIIQELIGAPCAVIRRPSCSHEILT